MPELIIACKSTLPSAWPSIPVVKLLFPDNEIRVRDLIAIAVREQCRLLMLNDLINSQDISVQLSQQYLSEESIAKQALEGSVKLIQPNRLTAFDPEIEIQKATTGFKYKDFMLLVGDERCFDLDDFVKLDLFQPVYFIRMIPLKGG